MQEIAVFGSINMDLILGLENFPQTGQTVKAHDFKKLPGGKGANQSIAASKLGGNVSMYGLLGSDRYAQILESSLKDAGVKISNVKKKPGVSGLAIVLVDGRGDNEIVIIPGANKFVNDDYAEKVFNSIAKSKFLLLQLETPLAGIKRLLNLLPTDKGPKVILDPAPAISLSRLPLDGVDIITPNESELETIVGDEPIDKAINRILRKDTSIIVKRGGRGSEYFTSESRVKVPAFNISVEDTTGAGDAFNGALAVALVEGRKIEDAIKFANAAGACATMKQGATSSLPNREKVEKLIES